MKRAYNCFETHVLYACVGKLVDWTAHPTLRGPTVPWIVKLKLDVLYKMTNNNTWSPVGQEAVCFVTVGSDLRPVPATDADFLNALGVALRPVSSAPLQGRHFVAVAFTEATPPHAFQCFQRWQRLDEVQLARLTQVGGPPRVLPLPFGLELIETDLIARRGEAIVDFGSSRMAWQLFCRLCCRYPHFYAIKDLARDAWNPLGTDGDADWHTVTVTKCRVNEIIAPLGLYVHTERSKGYQLRENEEPLASPRRRQPSRGPRRPPIHIHM